MGGISRYRGGMGGSMEKCAKQHAQSTYKKCYLGDNPSHIFGQVISCTKNVKTAPCKTMVFLLRTFKVNKIIDIKYKMAFDKLHNL